ncbi:MAG: (Na+)-NQR maturation NqrM [Proteobacteria bacterium]|nr:(Na+)-NQR maturation NqrM [Pseudomonadota bacterium]
MTLILAFGLMLLIVALMAVGVMFGREPISGSCGGMKKLGLDVGCEVCGGNPALCETRPGGSGPAGVSPYTPDNHPRI